MRVWVLVFGLILMLVFVCVRVAVGVPQSGTPILASFPCSSLGIPSKTGTRERLFLSAGWGFLLNLPLKGGDLDANNSRRQKERERETHTHTHTCT